MRGKVGQALVACVSSGITPAYAGKSKVCKGSEKLLRDHPRVCGEKEYKLNPERMGLGSPPRMRGKALAAAMMLAMPRITPAYAGKRSNEREH